MSSDSPPTRLVWVTRAITTPRHIEGLLEGLRAAEALDYAELRIMALTEDSAVTVPPGMILNGVALPGAVLTVDNLPPQGILYAESG